MTVSTGPMTVSTVLITMSTSPMTVPEGPMAVLTDPMTVIRAHACVNKAHDCPSRSHDRVIRSHDCVTCTVKGSMRTYDRRLLLDQLSQILALSGAPPQGNPAHSHRLCLYMNIYASSCNIQIYHWTDISLRCVYLNTYIISHVRFQRLF